MINYENDNVQFINLITYKRETFVNFTIGNLALHLIFNVQDGRH